ncbi:MAG: hypothetical protein WA830_16835 [Candidatus Sulfotelmatobacter sp.]
MIEKSGKVEATVFIPDGNDPLPGIVFIHSAIHGPYNNTDLLSFAWALARAGAASIILDGAIEWQSPNDDSIRPREFQFCAGQWLFRHVNLDIHRLADAGNFRTGWIPDGLSHGGIEPSGKARCWPGGFGMGFGQTTPVESHNTDLMLTLQGQLWMARCTQKQLGLKEINPEWLSDMAVLPPSSDAEVSNRQRREP